MQWTSAWFIARICGGGNEPARFLIQTDNQEFDSIKITENAWRNQGFLKTVRTGLLCTPDLVYCFFELISYSFQGERGKYMDSGRISWLWIPVQIFEFPVILPWLPMMQLYERELFLRFPFNADLEDVYAQVNSWNQHWGKGGKQYLYLWEQ